MLFADLALARRLERPEAIAAVRYVEARRRISPELRPEWMEAGGVYAMYDGPTSPVTQTFGLGLYSDVTSESLDRLEAFFRERGAPVIHEVSPFSGVPLAGQLSRRGYHPSEFTSILYRPLSRESQPNVPLNAELRVRLMEHGEEESWARTMARGWADQPEYQEGLLELGRLIASVQGVLAFFVHLHGDPIATGVLHIHEGVALFGGASTVPEARQQGAQRALFTARFQHALERGCDLAMMGAHPGSASQRNAERQGFHIGYTRTKWTLSELDTNPPE